LTHRCELQGKSEGKGKNAYEMEHSFPFAPFGTSCCFHLILSALMAPFTYPDSLPLGHWYVLFPLLVLGSDA
jgi:hypothetical protein